MARYKYEIITLNFEVTRKCNLQCAFCARGSAQNVDITHDIIDATLDQFKGVYINNLRINGGEPLLAPESIAYIVNGIIKRELSLAYCVFFTNGTIRDQWILDSMKKLADYLVSKKWEQTNPNYNKNIIHLYRTVNPEDRVTLLISQDYHENKNEIQKTIDFYSNKHPYVGIGLQDDLFQGQKSNKLIIEGLVTNNLKDLIGQALPKDMVVRKIDNRYNFIEWEPDYESPNTIKRITKTIGVSANGNVYIGCLMPYEKVDSNPICNVRDGGIFKSIEDYCWKHPITKKMVNAREYKAALEALKAKGIEVPDYGGLINGYMHLIDMFERYAVELHQAYPDMAPWHIQLGAAITLCHVMYTVGGDESIKAIESFVNLYLDPTFKEDIRQMLLTDVGRYKLANMLDRKWESIKLVKHTPPVLQELGAIMDSIDTALKNNNPKSATNNHPPATYAQQKRVESQARANSPRLQELRAQLAADQAEREKLHQESEM